MRVQQVWVLPLLCTHPLLEIGPAAAVPGNDGPSLGAEEGEEATVPRVLEEEACWVALGCSRDQEAWSAVVDGEADDVEEVWVGRHGGQHAEFCLQALEV